MNFTLDINIKAPELATAIQTLSNALVSAGIVMAGAKEVSQIPAPQMPQITSPAAPPIQYQIPQSPTGQSPAAYMAITSAPTQALPPQAPPVQYQTPPAPPQAQAPVAPPAPPQAPPAAPAPPATAPTYTMEQLAVSATQLMDAGRKPELHELLQSFGVAYLTQLPQEQFGAFATALRAKGVKL